MYGLRLEGPSLMLGLDALVQISCGNLYFSLKDREICSVAEAPKDPRIVRNP